MSYKADDTQDSSHGEQNTRSNKTIRVRENTFLSLILAAILGGGGIGVVMPKVAPGWYRPDPVKGEELRRVKSDVEALRREFNLFLQEGPREVRRNQDKILNELHALRQQLSRHRHQER